MTLATDLLTSIDARDQEGGWIREPVPRARDVIPKLGNVKRAWAGTAQVTIADTKVKLIDATAAPHPPAEIARAYLRHSLAPWFEEQPKRSMRRKRIPYHRQALDFCSIPPPEFYTPPRDDGGPWTYLDIRSCFPSIIARLSPVCEYRPGWPKPLLHCVGPAWPQVDEWMTQTESIRPWYGMLRKSDGVPELRYGKEIETPGRGRWFSPDLIGALFDTLHAVVGELRILCPSLCRWNTDGGFCRPEHAPLAVAHCRERWGLDLVVKAEGPGFVWGRITWHIGELMSANVKAGKAHPELPFDNMLPVRSEVRDLLAGQLRRG